jgi:glutamate synthase (NADPH/NADH) large chain
MKMAEVSPSEIAANACEARAETKPAATHGFGQTFGLPAKQGLYDPRNEHDACGVGFVAHMKGEKSHQIVRDGLFMLENLTHRGAVGLIRSWAMVPACWCRFLIACFAKKCPFRV